MDEILRKYCGFKELDGGVLRLDYRPASELLSNKFFMLLCCKGLHLQKASSPEEFFFPSSPETKSSRLSASHPYPKQPGCNSLPLVQPEGQQRIPNKHTHLNTHTELCW